MTAAEAPRRVCNAYNVGCGGTIVGDVCGTCGAVYPATPHGIHVLAKAAVASALVPGFAPSCVATELHSDDHRALVADGGVTYRVWDVFERPDGTRHTRDRWRLDPNDVTAKAARA